MIDLKEQRIIEFLKNEGESSSKEIFDRVEIAVSYATLKRILAKLIAEKYIATIGKGKGTKYSISTIYEVIQPVDIDRYFEKEIDERKIKEAFNFEIIRNVLAKNSVFTQNELLRLNEFQSEFEKNISQLSETEFKKEFERLAIDFSWKSSQIEGNTYSLLETEHLIKEKETAAGKTKEEAVMLLNHKDALDFILENRDDLSPLTVSKIEDIHSILVKELGIDGNLRKRRVGILGTNYRPLDNEFLIREALQGTCDLINSKEGIFEKAILGLILLSYIQPFTDGNMRTARIVSNALLMNAYHCPLSFRKVDSIDYKKAMLLFYEQNNISAIKKIFINQFEFAVNTYF